MCCGAGEGFGDDGSTAPGARIWCTSDFGAHWNQTFFKAEAAGMGFSLMELRWGRGGGGAALLRRRHPRPCTLLRSYVSDTEIWTCGATMTTVEPSERPRAPPPRTSP